MFKLSNEADRAAVAELPRAGDRDPGVGAGVEAAPVRARAGVGELRLGRLLDDAVHRLEGRHRARGADRVADPDRARLGRLRDDGGANADWATVSELLRASYRSLRAAVR